MARCQVCLKSGMYGNNVSHSKRRTRTRRSANVRHATIVEQGEQRKVAICTRCLRTHYRVIAKG
jgi:large subunit ribosomal protein L28